MGKTLKNMVENILIAGLAGIIGITGISSLIEKENSLKADKVFLNYPAPRVEIRLDTLQLNKNNYGILKNTLPKKEIQSNNLKLNRNDSIYYITNKNEEQGIEDILKIINTSDYEEKWLYLPEKQKWYEIGIGSYIDKKESIVYHRLKDIKKILKKNKNVKELIFYHNHHYSQNPSIRDIKSMISNSLFFSDCNVKEKICSKKGITEYSLTKRAIKEISSKGSKNIRDYLNPLNLEYPALTFKSFENKKCP